ncbi:chloride channel protein, partial [Burkholderia sp. Ac-20345]|nr:chloride channel protein [Burkholderia sp. Ac-20345]
SVTAATGVTEPQDAAAAPADPLDTLRDEGGEVSPAAAPAEGAANAPAPHDDEPAAAGTNGPAQTGSRDAQ